MTTRNLDRLFAPRAIAMIGASNRPGAIGSVVTRNLLEGGFSGPVMPVNPREKLIHGVACHASVSDLPHTPDLAVIATPPATIPGLIAELGASGTRAAIVISAGFDASQKQAMLDAARPHLLRIVGPNCLGVLSPARGINASFSHLAPDRGGIALITQSGAIATSMIDWARGRGIGLSHVLSLGDMSDVDFGDLLDYLALDPDTHSILIYAENITHARKFMSSARIAARAKPVIMVKAGASAAGARAAASHTGALAGSDAVYDAAIQRAGMLRVETLRDLFDAAETLASGFRPRGDRLLIVTNGGGLGVMATDALEKHGGRLASLSPATLQRLDVVLPRASARANPIDIIGDADGARYEATLDAAATEPGCDALLVMNCPTGVGDNAEAAEAVVRSRARNPGLPWFACWMGGATTSAPRACLAAAGIPNFETPNEAVRAFMHLAAYCRNQQALLEAPAESDAAAPQRDTARAIIAAVLAEGRDILTEPESKDLLDAYGIPVVRTFTAPDPDEAAQAASRIGDPVALKILSRQITHKSDMGGVRLDLETPDDVRAAAIAMLDRIRAAAPDAIIDGFTVQQMVRKPKAQELILGAVVDATFGPCILFGHGGVATEVIADRAIGLPPLNAALAQDMIRRTRVASLLAGYRDRPPADMAAISSALVALGQMMIDLPEIVELDINPLLADADGVIALDARVVIAPASDDPQARLAIRPWPAHLDSHVTAGGAPLRIRPAKPGDLHAIADLIARLDEPASLTAARLAQIDYDREMTLVGLTPDGSIASLVWLQFDPEFESATLEACIPGDAVEAGHAVVRQAIAYASGCGASRFIAAKERFAVQLAALLREAKANGGR